jgi:hypothetical protein
VTIVMTACALDAYRESAPGRGDVFLAKPCLPDTLGSCANRS